MIAFLIISLALLQSSQEYTETVTADFSYTVKSKYFVDKTLLIEEFFNDPVVKVITAPSLFGKSTVVDMIKRFAGIEIDQKGRLISSNTSNNYKLFCIPPLRICQNETFVRTHFGQYSIIHIDYKPLRNATVVSIIDQLKQIIIKTFSEHDYLLHSSSLRKSQFNQCYQPILQGKLNEKLIQNSFSCLQKLLHLHFGKQAVVLIDGYDIQSRSITEPADNEILDLLKIITLSVTKNNIHLHRALLTGVLCINLAGMSDLKHKHYRFLSNHKFSQFYGLTKKEVKKLIKKDVHIVERDDTHRTIKDFYGGYFIQKQNKRLYNTWSVISFLKNNSQPHTYWVGNQYLKDLVRNESFHLIKDIISEILLNGYVYGDVSHTLSTYKVILQKSGCNAKSNAMKEQIQYWFSAYLYDLGYLCTTKHYEAKIIRTPSIGINQTVVPLVIPNLEVQSEYYKFLQPDLEEF